MKTSRLFSKPILFGFLGLLPAVNASADILISENFSGSYTESNIIGQTATGTGLSGNWQATITGTAGNTHGASYTSSGLSFGTISTSGGGLKLTAGATTSGSNSIITGANTSDFAAVTGTLYSSYLYQVEGAYVTGTHAIAQRTGSTPTGNQAGGRFFLNPDHSATGTTAGVDYIGNAPTNGGATPALSTTYLTIGRFTNVGGAGGGTATMVTLDLAQYNDWVADGGTEALLFARVQGTDDQSARVKISDISTTQANFDGANNTVLQATINLGTGTDAFNVTFDEFKYATTFGEVVQTVPSGPTVPVLNIQTDGTDLVFTWTSTAGFTYALLSDDDLDPAPSLWSAVDGHSGIVADPPTNTLTIPRPALPRNFYTLEVTAP